MTKRAWRTLAGLGSCAVLVLTVGLNHAPASAATATPVAAAVPAGDGPPGF